MNLYTVDWTALANALLLPSIRKPNIKLLLMAFLQPIMMLHLEFLSYRSGMLYKVRHNSQICSMEAVLNDMFDPNMRRIRIINVSFKEAIYFYEPEERREVYHYEITDNKPVYYRELEELAGEGDDFIVCVPPSLRPLSQVSETAYTTRMSGQIDFYKLYSKNYSIVWEQVNV